MVWVQNTNAPKPQRYEFNLENFSGGLNNRSSVIEEHQASDMLNLHFTHQDVLEKRRGSAPYDALKLNAPISHMSLFRPYTGEDILMRATSTELYAGSTKVADLSGDIDAVNANGLFFFVDGVDMFAYGTFPSTTSIYLEVIGDIPAGHTVLKLVNPPTDYVPLPDIHSQGKLVFNYTAGTMHYEPCENERLDSYLGSNVIPANPRYIEYHKGRMFVSGDVTDDDNVYISDAQNPYYFAVSLPIQLPPNSDRVRGLYVYDDSLIIGREEDIYYIIGETNNPALGFTLFELKKLNTHTGVSNNRTMTAAHNFLFFLGSDGIAYAMTNIHTEGRVLKTQIISQNIDIFKDPIGATRDDLLGASAFFDDEYWYLSLGELTLVYSYRYQAWTVFNYVDIYTATRVDGELIWGRHDGQTFTFTDEHHDNGRPIFTHWASKNFDFGSATRYKQFREFYLVAHAWDDIDSDVRVTFEIDYSDLYNSVIVENKISFYGIAKYGDRFITRNINSSIPFMIGRRARYMRIKMANGFDVKGSVATLQDIYDVPRKYNYMCFYVEDESRYHYYENGVWIPLTPEKINQPMRVYKLNGDYEMKGKR